MNPHLPDWFSFYKSILNENRDGDKDRDKDKDRSNIIDEIMTIFDYYLENNFINIELFLDDLKHISKEDSKDNNLNLESIFLKRLLKLVKSIDKPIILIEEMKSLINNSFSINMKSREYSELIYELINSNSEGKFYNMKFNVNENIKILMAKSNINFDVFVDKVLEFSNNNNKKSNLLTKDDFHNILFKDIKEIEKLYK